MADELDRADLRIASEALTQQLGIDGVQWITTVAADIGRILPPDVEQRLRMEGVIKFRYREPEARLTRRGRRIARLVAEHLGGRDE
jgi:hypothetical protein